VRQKSKKKGTFGGEEGLSHNWANKRTETPAAKEACSSAAVGSVESAGGAIDAMKKKPEASVTI
jgi:hypothetical protein